MPTISLQASKFIKNELLHTYFSRGFYLDFNLLFIVFFLRNDFGRLFHVSMEVVCFSDGGGSFISDGGGGGRVPQGAALALGYLPHRCPLSPTTMGNLVC